MASHWKSTPSYWCRYCETYIRDSPLERKNHETSSKHQHSIARSIRTLTKNQEREQRDQQRAKDEVARLNGLVGGKGASSPGISGLTNVGRQTSATRPAMSAEAQRKLHAGQLAALGIELPEELKREVTGVGNWQTVSERVVEEQALSLAGIKAEEDSKDDVKEDGFSRGVRKRKVEDDDDEDHEAAYRRRAWGSSRRTYPGAVGGEEDAEDLDALLSGLGRRAKELKTEEDEEKPQIKMEESAEESAVTAVPALGVEAPSTDELKQEPGEVDVPPAVVFKKRKVKK